MNAKFFRLILIILSSIILFLSYKYEYIKLLLYKFYIPIVRVYTITQAIPIDSQNINDDILIL